MLEELKEILACYAEVEEYIAMLDVNFYCEQHGMEKYIKFPM